MKMVCVVTGSRADEGLLCWPEKCLREDGTFAVTALSLHDCPSILQAQEVATKVFEGTRPDWVLLLGDRFEILGCAISAHLLRIPIAHLCGGDVSEGSYDDAMRDCISRVATLHFATSEEALARLLAWGCQHVHLVGNPGLDYIRHGDWKRGRPYADPYVVVSYQVETQDGTEEFDTLAATLPEKYIIFLMPNLDRGSADLCWKIAAYVRTHPRSDYFQSLPHDQFLNLLAHCDEFIGNSSAIFYEAPELGVKTRLIGMRQQGRVRPWGDGYASERLVKILKEFDQQAVSA